MSNSQDFFDFAAYVGLTKHLGGVAATDRLLAQCQVGAGKIVLDVGCGAGQPHATSPGRTAVTSWGSTSKRR